MTVLDRIEAAKKSALPSRLLRGAELLGKFWKAGQRCISEWARICPCQNQTEFCQVKVKWVALADEFYGKPPWGMSGYETFYVVEAMTVSQWRASGLTALVQVPGREEFIRVGIRGTTWKTLVDLADLQDDEVALAVGIDAVIKLQEVAAL